MIAVIVAFARLCIAVATLAAAYLLIGLALFGGPVAGEPMALYAIRLAVWPVAPVLDLIAITWGILKWIIAVSVAAMIALLMWGLFASWVDPSRR